MNDASRIHARSDGWRVAAPPVMLGVIALALAGAALLIGGGCAAAPIAEDTMVSRRGPDLDACVRRLTEESPRPEGKAAGVVRVACAWPEGVSSDEFSEEDRERACLDELYTEVCRRGGDGVQHIALWTSDPELGGHAVVDAVMLVDDREEVGSDPKWRAARERWLSRRPSR